ncbi:MAG: (2Fe-2S)-binding protein [Betaproteobacteria bacterium]|nr:(2Fe-2S)-binding protein [Betaproteobacteria bacterium]
MARSSNRKLQFFVNGTRQDYNGDGDQPLLWHLRDQLRLTGTKFGCGTGLCGACTVHVEGKPARACVVNMGSLAGKRVTTVEGLAGKDALHPVQQAWREANVPQCGYCQAGQMMAAAALVAGNSAPDDAAIDEALRGNLCRCGTYARIRVAVKRAAELSRANSGKSTGRTS